jgi:hypothetical protein
VIIYKPISAELLITGQQISPSRPYGWNNAAWDNWMVFKQYPCTSFCCSFPMGLSFYRYALGDDEYSMACLFTEDEVQMLYERQLSQWLRIKEVCDFPPPCLKREAVILSYHRPFLSSWRIWIAGTMVTLPSMAKSSSTLGPWLPP